MMVWAAPLDYDWTYRLKQACIKTKQKKNKTLTTSQNHIRRPSGIRSKTSKNNWH